MKPLLISILCLFAASVMAQPVTFVAGSIQAGTSKSTQTTISDGGMFVPTSDGLHTNGLGPSGSIWLWNIYGDYTALSTNGYFVQHTHGSAFTNKMFSTPTNAQWEVDWTNGNVSSIMATSNRTSVSFNGTRTFIVSNNGTIFGLNGLLFNADGTYPASQLTGTLPAASLPNLTVPAFEMVNVGISASYQAWNSTMSYATTEANSWRLSENLSPGTYSFSFDAAWNNTLTGTNLHICGFINSTQVCDLICSNTWQASTRYHFLFTNAFTVGSGINNFYWIVTNSPPNLTPLLYLVGHARVTQSPNQIVP